MCYTAEIYWTCRTFPLESGVSERPLSINPAVKQTQLAIKKLCQEGLSPWKPCRVDLTEQLQFQKERLTLLNWFNKNVDEEWYELSLKGATYSTQILIELFKCISEPDHDIIMPLVELEHYAWLQQKSRSEGLRRLMDIDESTEDIDFSKLGSHNIIQLYFRPMLQTLFSNHEFIDYIYGFYLKRNVLTAKDIERFRNRLIFPLFTEVRRLIITDPAQAEIFITEVKYGLKELARTTKIQASNIFEILHPLITHYSRNLDYEDDNPEEVVKMEIVQELVLELISLLYSPDNTYSRMNEYERQYFETLVEKAAFSFSESRHGEAYCILQELEKYTSLVSEVQH